LNKLCLMFQGLLLLAGDIKRKANIMMMVLKSLFISIIAMGMLAQYVPAPVKQSSCCSCCKTVSCGCGCNQQRIHPDTHSSTDIPTCDFNTCNGTTPFNSSTPVFLNLSYAESIKKLGSGVSLDNGRKTTDLFLSYTSKPFFITHLLSPPPVYLLNSCFIL